MEPYKTATYDGLRSRLTRRWGDSQFGIAYTFSKAINYADNDAGPRIRWMPEAYRNRGPAQYDRTHTFHTNWVPDLPFGKGQRWATSGIAGKLLGGLPLNGLLSAMSGYPRSSCRTTRST